MSYQEIATFLDLPVSTIRGRLQKARGKLRTLLAEDMAMAPVDVTDEVSEMICKVAREEIDLRFAAGRFKHLAIYLDIPTQVNVVGHDQEEVIVRGHKTAIGEDEAQAQAMLENIQLLHDEVDNWVEAGQHEGERFIGTDSSRNRPKAITAKSGGRVTEIDRTPSQFFNHLNVEDVYPHVVPSQTQLDRINQAMPVGGDRISLVSVKAMDMVVPNSVLTEEIKEGFKWNWFSEEMTHGQVGRAVLEIAVPKGVSVS